MRIVYIANSPVPSLAANAVHVMKMAQALAAHGHEVLLLTPEYKRVESCVAQDLFAHYGVGRIFRHRRVPFLNLPRLRFASHILALLLLTLSSRPQLIYTRNRLAADLLSLMGRRVVFELHDLPDTTGIARLQRLAARRATVGIVVISQSLADAVKDFVPRHKLIVAHDGADPCADVAPLLPPAVKTRLGYTGHLYPGRGIDVLGAMMRHLPDCELHIVGGTPGDIAHWQTQFAGQANIVFHGHVAPDQVPGWLKSFDILLAPYQRKVAVSGGHGDTSRFMSPLKIFEYMAAGRPLIASDIPVLGEVLGDGENCLLCPPDDPAHWAEAIARLRDDPELAKRLAGAALAEFTGRYSWHARAGHILTAVELAQTAEAR